jgi:hypothetical protein
MELSSYTEPEPLFAWAKYLYWADLQYRHFEATLDHSEDPHKWLFFGTMSLWYGSEYVVVEGWHHLARPDSVIDDLLQSHRYEVDLLRKYRNTVFHYQPSLIDKRILDFHEAPERIIPWLHHLHAEFLRYYWEFVSNFPGAEEHRAALHDAAIRIVGWVPVDIFPARLREAYRIAKELEAMTEGDDSPEAEDLRSAGRRLIDVAERAMQKYRADLAAFQKEARG